MSQLSIEAAWQDFGVLQERVKHDIHTATKYAQTPPEEKSILATILERDETYLDRRFDGDAQFRAYLYTRDNAAKERIAELAQVPYLRESVSYRDELIFAPGGREAQHTLQTESEDGKRQLVVKFLRPDADAGVARAFAHEQEVLARLRDHYPDRYPRNLLKLYGYGPGITVTEMVPGAVNLRDQIRSTVTMRPYRRERAFRFGYFRDIVDGLTAMYAAGFTYHGDLKPDNCILGSDGIVRIGDYSLVDERAGEHVGKYGSTSGSPRYMSPERVIAFSFHDRPAVVDTRADVWALGVILHEILTGGDDLFKRHKMSENDRKHSVSWLIAAFAPFILNRKLPFRDELGHSFTDEQLFQISKFYNFTPLGGRVCYELFDGDQNSMSKVDEVIRHATDNTPDYRYDTPAEMYEALRPVIESVT